MLYRIIHVEKKIVHSYELDGAKLDRLPGFSDLGVFFDEELTFNNHIANTISVSYRTLGCILRKGKNLRDTKTLKLLFTTFVRSKMEYASIIWSPYYACHVASIERVQRIFLKYLWYRQFGIYPHRGFNQDVLLSHFHLISMARRHNYLSVLFLFKILSGIFSCISVLQNLDIHIPRISARAARTFYLPWPRTNNFYSSPLYKICETYNNIQQDIDIFFTSVRSLKAYFHNQ